jgi:hypothetical protein
MELTGKPSGHLLKLMPCKERTKSVSFHGGFEWGGRHHIFSPRLSPNLHLVTAFSTGWTSCWREANDYQGGYRSHSTALLVVVRPLKAVQSYPTDGVFL